MARSGTGVGRRVVLLIVVAIAWSVHPGVASNLPMTATRIGGGTAAVTACDSNGFTFRLAVNAASRVPSVNVSGIHASCAGGTLRVTLVNAGSDVGSGSAALPSSGFSGTADISISPLPTSDGITAVVAVIEGP